MRFNASTCSRSSRASSRSIARVPPLRYAIPALSKINVPMLSMVEVKLANPRSWMDLNK